MHKLQPVELVKTLPEAQRTQGTDFIYDKNQK